MKNISDTEAYNTFDHIFSKTLRSLSRVVGLRKMTRPFWNRWRASGVDETVIFQFLDRVGTIDNWADRASDVVGEAVARFDARRGGLTSGDEVRGLRELSFLHNMAQWGCLPITPQRTALYRKCRDYYVEAETLAFADRYERISNDWKGQMLHANLHVPPGAPAPLVIIVHGIDGCKEEHLATELRLLDAGFSVMSMDGPGQAEALLLDGILWTHDFHRSISAAIAGAARHSGVDASRCGLIGISIGGTWSLMAASQDQRIAAVYDLGAAIHTRGFPRLPFLIKTRLCQVTGARDWPAIQAILAQNNIEDDDVLSSIRASVRILHGGRDLVVSVADKQWLHARLSRFNKTSEISMRIIEDGDHCCTGHADDVRADLIAFFQRTLAQPAASNSSEMRESWREAHG